MSSNRVQMYTRARVVRFNSKLQKKWPNIYSYHLGFSFFLAIS